MARIRTVKPEFWSAEQVVECSTNARLLFIGLWNFCDDRGHLNFSPRQIKGLVFPSDDFTSADIEAWLGELLKNRLIGVYQSEGKQFLEVTGWKHQKIDRPQAPRFPERSTSEPLSFDERTSNDRRTFETEHITHSHNTEKEKHSHRSGQNLNGHAAEVDQLAEEFYEAYPKHVNPLDAKAKFVKAVKRGADPNQIVAAAKSWNAAWSAAGTDQQYIPAPAVWLNKGSYASRDLPKPPARASPVDNLFNRPI